MFREFIKNVYMSATPGRVNNLQPVAPQQDAFLGPAGLVVEVVRAIKSVRFQIWLGSFGMTNFVHLPPQESMAHRSAGIHYQWNGYMTVLVVNHEMIKSITILTMVICARIKFDVDPPQDWFNLEAKRTMVICYLHLTLSVSYLGHIHHLPQALK